MTRFHLPPRKPSRAERNWQHAATATGILLWVIVGAIFASGVIVAAILGAAP